MCVNVCKVREQRKSVLLFSVGPRDQIQDVRLGGKNLCTLSHHLSCLHHLVTFKNNWQGSRDGSATKSTGCSSGKIMVSPALTLWLTPIWRPLLVSLGTWHACGGHTYKKAKHPPLPNTRVKEKQNSNNNKKQLRLPFIIFGHWLSQLQSTRRKKSKVTWLDQGVILSHHLKPSLKRSFAISTQSEFLMAFSALAESLPLSAPWTLPTLVFPLLLPSTCALLISTSLIPTPLSPTICPFLVSWSLCTYPT